MKLRSNRTNWNRPGSFVSRDWSLHYLARKKCGVFRSWRKKLHANANLQSYSRKKRVAILHGALFFSMFPGKLHVAVTPIISSFPCWSRFTLVRVKYSFATKRDARGKRRGRSKETVGRNTEKGAIRFFQLLLISFLASFHLHTWCFGSFLKRNDRKWIRDAIVVFRLNVSLKV